MSRRYHLNHFEENKKEEVLREIKKLREITSVEIDEEMKQISVEADDENFCQVMDRIVNICKKISQDCELTYAF